MNIIILSICMIVSFIFGYTVADISNIHLAKELLLTDIIDIILTLVIVFILPFTVNKILSFEKDSKNIIVDDIHTLLAIVDKLHRKILSKKELTLNKEDRQDISFLFSDLSRQSDLIEILLKQGFNKKSDSIISKISTSFLKFKSEITGGELMNSDFVLDRNFIRDFEKQHDEYIKIIKCLTFDIKKL